MILNNAPVIFRDNFDTKNPGIPSRTGDLDPNVWGVSRTSGYVNFGQMANLWASTALVGCGGTTQVQSPNDVVICNGQLREASNDNPSGAFENGSVTVLAMYPKQPFDFAGRTGTVAFDVSNDTHGTHAAWPEFWITDKPVPAPFAHFTTWKSLPQHGIGIRLDGYVDANGHQASAPEGAGYVGVGSAILIRDYVGNDSENAGSTVQIKGFACVKQPTAPGQMNHYEVRISQNQIDVYGTDAGVAPTAATLKHLATVTNANLGFTAGLIWLQDAHYNADKGGSPSQRQHTFVWDNVEFDGPFTYRDFSYDALDANTVNNSAGGPAVDLGKLSGPNESSSWDVLNMPASPQAAAVRVLFNFYHYAPPATLNVTVNGHAHAVAWPYPDTAGFTWRTLAVSVPITDLVTGTNVVTIGGSDQPVVVSNVNIVLVNVPGGVPVLPGSNNAYPTSSPPPPPPPPPPVDTVTVTFGAVPQLTVPKGQSVTVSIPVTINHQ